jgi:2-oxoglutarate ferredoxin oxidoreductase subunit alpha
MEPAGKGEKIMKDKQGRCDVSVRIGGEAGQGMKVISNLLGKVFLRSGLSVFTHHDIMSRIRGGHNFSQIRLSDLPVRAPSSQVDILICLDKTTLSLYGEGMNGVVIYDQEKVGEKGPAGEKYLPIPLEKIAKEKGRDARMANSVASGAALSVLGLSLDLLLELLEETFGSKGENVVLSNKECALAGFDLAGKGYKGKKLCTHVRTKKKAGRMLISGSEAMALGALASNIHFYSAYPMSPATPIMEYLAAKAKDLRLVVEQAEDEIAAVNMVIGASFCGARSMVATSGGGLALMVEAISLAGMTETPLVIVDCQRPAPATGLPTRTEQADLLFVAHCAHGEFPRAVFAPATAEDAFFLTAKAFYLAEKYQTPVFILGDQYLNDSSWTEEPFDLKKARREEGNLLSEKDLAQSPPYRYKRYAVTESGISPRMLPGTRRQVVYADSDEHTEEGHITESADVRCEMVTKRLRKGIGLKGELSPPRVFPDEKAEQYLVSWGSTLGAVEEAVGLLRDKGMNIGFLHFSEVYPLREDAIPPNLRDNVDFIMVENNATGQFAKLLRMETGVSIDRRILKFDGRPFSGQELARTVEEKNGG